MWLFLTALAAFLMTYIGGWTASRIKDKKHLLLAFGAGAVLGVSLFDLLPESSHLLGDMSKSTLFVATGFGIYFLLNNKYAMTAHKEHDVCHNHQHTLSILPFTMHNLVDGLMIGFAFQASPVIGVSVAAGIVAHRFWDGINTVTLGVRNGDTSWKWLHINASMPVIGIVIGSLLKIPGVWLGCVLAVAAGLLLYVSASDLVPECHHEHPKFSTSAAFVMGVAFIWAVVNFTHA